MVGIDTTLFLLIALSATYWTDSVAQTEDSLSTEEYKLNTELIKTVEKSFPEGNHFNSTNQKIRNSTDSSNSTKSNSSVVSSKPSSSTSDPKEEAGQKSSPGGINAHLLFPTLPFLFPRKREGGDHLKKNELTSKEKEGDEEPKRGEGEGKPFVFFKFAFNIRQIPINNGSDHQSKDPKMIDPIKKMESNRDNPLENFKKGERKRRSSMAGKSKEIEKFFDEFSLFPEAEEFFSKPDFLFPEFFLHRKPSRKLGRKKRDMKKPDLKRDLKFFTDVFDETFAKTQREFEERNPFLDFLRGGEEKRLNFFVEDDSMSGKSPLENSNWKIEKENSKRSEKDTGDDSMESLGNPLIIVDDVLKIGEVRDDRRDPTKSKNKKKLEGNDSKKKHRETNHGESQDMKSKISTNEFEFFNPANLLSETGRWKKNFESMKKIRGKSDDSISFGKNFTAGETGNGVEKRGKVVNSTVSGRKWNSTENFLNYAGKLLKMMNSLQEEIRESLTGGKSGLEKESPTGFEPETKKENRNDSRKPIYVELEKNITRVLKQFLSLFKNLDDSKAEMANESDSFDWTETETLQNSNFFGKRSKKNSDFDYDSVDKIKVAKYNMLFLTVTLPTVIVGAVLVGLCYYTFRVNGKVCKKLFKPRHVFIVENELTSQLEKIKNIRTLREI